MKSESKPSYKCKYCERAFAKESTLLSHLCEQKRRVNQQNETGVQFGYQAYIQFYETTQGPAKNKSYEDFSSSPYYSAFVKYGRYCVAIHAINFVSFTSWLLKNNKKLDFWCKDSLYEEWMLPYLQKESPQDALERALKEMQKYADDHPELKNGFRDYFQYGNGNRICHHIVSGRISPWIIYNCATGVDFLYQLGEEQIGIVLPYIDPAYWQKKFKDYPADVAWVKEVLTTAGL